MKTNKEKALQYIEDNVSLGCQNYDINVAKEAIEIASKPDWYYPSKGEFPPKDEETNDNCSIMVIVHREISDMKELEIKGDIDYYDYTNNTWYHNRLVKVIAWTYLPNPPKPEEEGDIITEPIHTEN